MNTNKADSLFQSMEKWIDLYRDKHGCSHNDAHDAFEAWSDKLRGESADQTTKSFHEAVVSSYNEMRGVVVVDTPPEPKQVSYHTQSGLIVASKPPSVVVKGVHLKDSKSKHAGPLGGPILDTGKDPLAFVKGSVDKLEDCEPFFHTPRPVLTPAEVRASLEKVIRDTNKYLDELGDTGHPSDIARTKEAKELAENRLKMIDELEVREKERKGKRLSLKGE
jgi:hypothetical protein